ncbi:MAG: hypothetical protein N2692_00490 [Patescibacteria group bacterium]|nr:hypothetical protein [Patescibacteria group bacterium]
MLKQIALLVEMIRSFEQLFPQKKISRTMLNALIFLYQYDKKEKWGFLMSPSGVFFSDLIDHYVAIAETAGYIEIKFNGKGYYFTFVKTPEYQLKEKEKERIKKFLEVRGELSLNELIILTRAKFLFEELQIKKGDLLQWMSRECFKLDVDSQRIPRLLFLI